MAKRVLVLASGGADSSTLLARAVDEFGSDNVIALSISYGQKHAREVESAKSIAAYYQVPLKFLDLGAVFADCDSSLMASSDNEVPHESYAHQLDAANGTPVDTYIPFRNGLFLSAAASVALSNDCKVVMYGAHSDDAAGNAYPDCSSAFVSVMRSAIEEGTGGTLTLDAPFVGLHKSDIIALGLKLDVPYELTWSCYEGGDLPCGECATCIDRAKAFEANGVTDPLLIGAAQ